MRGIGVHVCSQCGDVSSTLGAAWSHEATHARCWCEYMEDLNLPCWCENTMPGFQLDPDEQRWESEGGQTRADDLPRLRLGD